MYTKNFILKIYISGNRGLPSNMCLPLSHCIRCRGVCNASPSAGLAAVTVPFPNPSPPGRGYYISRIHHHILSISTPYPTSPGRRHLFLPIPNPSPKGRESFVGKRKNQHLCSNPHAHLGCSYLQKTERVNRAPYLPLRSHEAD
jgi:hypothetical protein